MHETRASFPSTASTPEAPPTRQAYPIVTATGADAMRHRLDALGLESATNLLQAQLPQPTWLVRGVLPEGVSLLVAKPKVGKSLAASEIAVSIATGGLCFGKYETDPGDVVYFAFEGGRAGHQQRLRKQLGAAPPPEALHMAYELHRLDQGGIEHLYAIHEALPSLRLIVIDVLRYVRPETHRRSSLYDEDYGALQPLQEFYSKTGVSVLAIHHSRKEEVASNPLDVVSGSTGLTGSATNILVMTGSAQQKRAQITIVPREQESATIDLDFDGERLSWVAAQPALPLAGSPEQQRVLDAYREAEGPAKAKDIAEKTGLSYDSVRQLIGKLVRDGHLVRLNSGLYKPTVITSADLTSAAASTSPAYSDQVPAETCERDSSSGPEPIRTIHDFVGDLGCDSKWQAIDDDDEECDDIDGGLFDDDEDTPLMSDVAPVPTPQSSAPAHARLQVDPVVAAGAPMAETRTETPMAAAPALTADRIVPAASLTSMPSAADQGIADAPPLTAEQEHQRSVREAAFRAAMRPSTMPRPADRASAPRPITGHEPEWPARSISAPQTLFGPNGEVNR